MKIIKKGKTKENIDIQIEDWSQDYSFMKKNATIGFYPVSQISIYKEDRLSSPAYPEINKTFRASFDFETETEANDAFDNLINGKKSLLDYIDNYYSGVLSTENFIKALVGYDMYAEKYSK